jgi:suppressor for copper-sensitivity B
MTFRLTNLVRMTKQVFGVERTMRSLAGAILASVFMVLGAGLGSGPAAALSTDWLDHEQARVRLIAAGGGTSGGQAGDELRLGLQFSLEPGWKIYWRTPGEAGIPPVLDWSASQNLASAEMRWPVPHRFTLFGLDTFGYDGEVVLPVLARAQDAGRPVRLEAQLSYLICSDICIPHDGKLALDLPAGGIPPGAEGFLISQAERLVPGDGRGAGLALDRALLVGDPSAPALEVVARSEIPFEAPDLLVEGPPGYLFAAPAVEFSEDRQEAVLRVESERGLLAEGVLEGKMVTLTLTDGRRGMEQAAITRFASGMASPVAADAATLLQILALAVLGGLILNLMPCVLPVLSIKLLSVVKQGGRDRKEVRISFLASAAGILFSFMVLAGLAIALKSGGMAVGWGIQFQQPLFLTAMAVLLTLFACNLLGFFEIPLPRALADVAGEGQGHGLVGHFSTGAFATLLATPCSAPFLGTAVGFAFARGAGEILMIFAALGVGLALPYLAVAAAPGLATRLPRPGPWMVTLRRILGLALAGTAVWLLSVLVDQVSLTAAILAGALLLLLGAVLALRRHLKRWLGPALATLLAMAVLVLPAGFGPGERAANAGAGDGWVAFDQGEIARRVAAGEVVFVDVTADWCLTCKFNKSNVIDTDAVTEDFEALGVIRMRADWTSPSDEISDYLASFGRYGIPFNVVYGPGAPAGETLPELLTVNAVLAATDKAAGGGVQISGP